MQAGEGLDTATTRTESALLPAVLADGSPLANLAEAAAQIGADEIVAAARLLAERVAEGRFYVACIGQFKRGKSTLLNALVGEPILPTGVAPVTSVVTVLRHGPRRCARVRFEERRWRDVDPGTLAAYVTETQNPGNEKKVDAVEVEVPSPLLAGGMCLVDTPGIGSVFAGGSIATRRFVPHIDAALVVLGSDPPISGDELSLIQDVAEHAHEMIVVLNKADRLSDADRAEATSFTRRILAKHVPRGIEAILEISATEAAAGDPASRDWDLLRARLETLAREGGAGLVREAESRGRKLLASRLLGAIAEQRQAILRPLEESAQRIEAIRRSAEDAERSLDDLSYLLSAEEDRLAATLRARQRDFSDGTIPEVRAAFKESMSRLDETRGPRVREEAIAVAQRLSRQWLERWRTEQQPFAESEYRRAADRFLALGNEFLARLRGAGLSGLPPELEPETGFRTRSRLFYKDLLTYAPVTFWTRICDRILPRKATARAVERAAGEYLERLLTVNTSRIVGEILEQTLESRRRLESELRTHIQSVDAAARRTLERARATQAEGGRAVESEVARLGALAEGVRDVEGARGGSAGA